MKTHYTDGITISPVSDNSPQIKITRIYVDTSDKIALKQQILQQNHWLTNASFEIMKTYKITAAKEPYSNIVCKTDLPTQKLLLDKDSIILGLTQCRLFEHINLLQCGNCQRYGHFKRQCALPPHCKKCSEAHPTAECPSTKFTNSCINCIVANRSGYSFNVRHNVSDDRCPTRMERIDALKVFHASKN